MRRPIAPRGRADPRVEVVELDRRRQGPRGASGPRDIRRRAGRRGVDADVVFDAEVLPGLAERSRSRGAHRGALARLMTAECSPLVGATTGPGTASPISGRATSAPGASTPSTRWASALEDDARRHRRRRLGSCGVRPARTRRRPPGCPRSTRRGTCARRCCAGPACWPGIASFVRSCHRRRGRLPTRALLGQATDARLSPARRRACRRRGPLRHRSSGSGARRLATTTRRGASPGAQTCRAAAASGAERARHRPPSRGPRATRCAGGAAGLRDVHHAS